MAMRLLHVHDLTLRSFPLNDLPQYAIASHRWRVGDEAMLKDVVKRRNTETSGYKKVEGFAKYVRENVSEVEYIWIDTCCIDQKSSQEVSEAINSMFRYYRDAYICLAYLADVDNCKDIEQFKQSSWHRRGWTLQEMLAPRLVRFLDRHWNVVGHKGPDDDELKSFDDLDSDDVNGISLNRHISSITNIPERVLHKGFFFDQAAAEKRIRWIAGRETTRDEDLSYCLLGLLGVTMPIIYGEGSKKALSRLLSEAAGISPTLAQSLPLQLEIEALYHTNRTAAQLLFLMSMCDQRAIPGVLLRPSYLNQSEVKAVASEEPCHEKPQQSVSPFEVDMGILIKKSYVRPLFKMEVWSLSDDIQIATVDWLTQNDRFKFYRDLFVDRLHNAIPSWEDKDWLPCWRHCHELTTQVQQLQHRPSTVSAEIVKRANILYRFCWFLRLKEEGPHSVGQHVIAMSEESRSLLSAELGPEHPDTLRSMMLAAINQRDFSYQFPKTFGIITIQKNYASVETDHVKRAQKAVKDLTRIRATAIQVLGPDDECSIECRLHLIWTCYQAGRTKEALELAREAATVARSRFSRDRLNGDELCRALCVIGRLYLQNVEKANAALLMLQEARDLRTSKHSQFHPVVVENMHLLALAHMHHGSWRDAEDLLAEVYLQYNELLRSEHPRTKSSLSDLVRAKAKQRLQAEQDGTEKPHMEAKSGPVVRKDNKPGLWNRLTKK